MTDGEDLVYPSGPPETWRPPGEPMGSDDELAAFYDIPENREPVGPAHRLPSLGTTRRVGPLSISYTRNCRRVSIRWVDRFVVTWASIRRPPRLDDVVWTGDRSYDTPETT
jgi:hypothetical protein